MKGTFDGGYGDVFPGTSEMSQIMRGFDWASTPLGEPGDWPEGLKTPLQMLLTTRFEMWLGWGPDLCFFYNDAYIPTLGIKHPHMLGRPLREVWSEVYQDVAEQVERVRAGEATWNKAMLLLLERSGYPEETYHSFSYSPLFDSDGSVGGLLCVVSEETSRVISERRLETLRNLGSALTAAASREALLGAVAASFEANRKDFPFAILQLGNERSPADAERYMLEAESLAEANLAADGILELPSDVEWPSGDWDRMPREAAVISIPYPGGGTAGRLILGLNPYRRHDPDIIGFATLAASQIGSALAGIAALDDERRRANRIWSVSRDIMVVVDEVGTFRSVSPAWTRILGHQTADVVGSHFSVFMHPDDVAASRGALSEAFADQELSNYRNRYRAVDGRYHQIEWHTTKEDDLIYAYGRDVTERLQVEEELEESREQFRHLVQGVTDYAIYMIDQKGYVSSWNEGARNIKGYEPDEIIGSHFSQFYTEEDRAKGEPVRALETARRHGRFAAEGWRVRKSGERFRASVVIDAIRDDQGNLIGFAKITRDITEKDEAQRNLEAAREALYQSQKLEAIGQLTGGIAHDFNNLLMAVSGSLELLGRRLPEDPISQRLHANAVEGARRGATLTQRMLAFARRQTLAVEPVDLPGLLEGMTDLAQRSIGPEWPLSADFPKPLPPVLVDGNQLEMALLNLIVNARDAMPSGGSIHVAATLRDAEEGAVEGLAAGRYVRCVVSDEGIGMDAATLCRAAEPFFTTKGIGKGTGLGLPMVQGMVAQLGGAFEIQSEPGEGTSVILWLPVANGDAVQAPVAVAQDLRRGDMKLKVLVVDDDALVLMNTASLLEDLDHTVVEAYSGADGLEKFRANTDIDLIITDQAMPQMTGVELLAAIDEVRHGLPAILASGYGEGVDTRGRDVVRLGKPFSQMQLAQAIELARRTAITDS